MEWLVILFIVIGFVLKQTTQKSEEKEQMPPFNKDAKSVQQSKKGKKHKKQQQNDTAQPVTSALQNESFVQRPPLRESFPVEKLDKQQQANKQMIVPTSANDLAKAFILAEVLGPPKAKQQNCKK